MSETDSFQPLLAVGMQYIFDVSPNLSEEETNKLTEVLKNFINNKIFFKDAAKEFRLIIGTSHPLEKIDHVLKINDFPIPSPKHSSSNKPNRNIHHSTDKKKSHLWNEYEDLRLLAGIHRYGTENWTTVSKFVGNGRTRSQCSQRWIRGLDPRISKVEWTREEDKRLLDLVLKNGSKAWTKIASRLGNRSDAQCRYRFHQIRKENEEKERMKKIMSSLPTPNIVLPMQHTPVPSSITIQKPDHPTEKMKLPSINLFMEGMKDLPNHLKFKL